MILLFSSPLPIGMHTHNHIQLAIQFSSKINNLYQVEME